MRVTIFAQIANAALGWLFIFGLSMGVKGAAWATVMAQALEAGLLLRLQPDRITLKVKWKHLRMLLHVGTPTAIQATLEIWALTLVTMIVSVIGQNDMAAHQIALQITNFAFLPTCAIGEAASVLAGQAVGVKRDALVLRIAHQALLLVVLYVAVCCLPLTFGARLIASIFVTGDVSRAITVRLLYIAAAFILFDGLSVVGRAVLRGVGDVRYPAVVTIVLAWVLSPPLAYLAGLRWGWGVFGCWLGVSTQFVVGTLIFWRRLEARTWVGASLSITSSFGPPTLASK
jgi:MATE family multidrug resistance protein